MAQYQRQSQSVKVTQRRKTKFGNKPGSTRSVKAKPAAKRKVRVRVKKK